MLLLVYLLELKKDLDMNMDYKNFFYQKEMLCLKILELKGPSKKQEFF